jgi:hypothetical protein
VQKGVEVKALLDSVPALHCQEWPRAEHGGAIAGHLLTSTMVSGTMSGATEMTSVTAESDGKRLADKIAQDFKNFLIK